MNLGITMRYIMVQAQKAANGEQPFVEHILIALLELSQKQAKKIARNPEQLKEISADIELLRQTITERHINPDITIINIRNELNRQIYGYDGDLFDSDSGGLMARAEKRMGQGISLSAMAVFMTILDEPTGVIPGCIVIDEKEDKSQGLWGEDTVPDLWESQRTVPQYDMETVLEPETETEQVPEPEIEQTFEPSPPGGVVFFEIPSPKTPNKPDDMAIYDKANYDKALKITPQKIKLTNQKTQIAGITLKGGPVVALLKYYLFVLVIPFIVVWVINALKPELLTPSNPLAKAAILIGAAFWVVMLLKGLTGLVGLRFKPFEIFVNTLINGLFVYGAVLFVSDALGRPDMTSFARVLTVVLILLLVFVSKVRLKSLQIMAGQNGHALSTTMLKIFGTPSAIFFEYALRSTLLPLIIVGVVWGFDVEINSFWQAAFAIYAFFWAYDVVRMMLKCWSLRYERPFLPIKKQRMKKIITFFEAQHLMLGLPAFGLFLMWYFNWFPMPVWLIVIYSIYGVFWLIGAIAGLIQIGK